MKELIPIKDLVQILESLIDYSKVTKNIEVLTEYVRHSLGDTIATLYKDSNNVIHAVAVGEELRRIYYKFTITARRCNTDTWSNTRYAKRFK